MLHWNTMHSILKESSKNLYEYIYTVHIYTFRYTPLLHCCLKASGVFTIPCIVFPVRPCSCCFGVRSGAEAWRWKRQTGGGWKCGNVGGNVVVVLMVGLFVGCCSFFCVSYFFYFYFLDARCLFWYVLVCFCLFVLICFVLLDSIFEDIEDWIMHFQKPTPWIFLTQHVFFWFRCFEQTTPLFLWCSMLKEPSPIWHTPTSTKHIPTQTAMASQPPPGVRPYDQHLWKTMGFP